MTQNTERQTFWIAAKQGWKASIIVGLAVLLIRFKALIPLVWQILEKNGSVHTLGKALGDLVLIAGGLLFIYAVRTGYRRSDQALELSNNALGGSISNSSIALRTIGQVSLFVNAPILYWAFFLFVLLPQLIKIPNASLRIGTTAALAGAFISMAVIVVLATHIGLLLIKFSFKSLVKVPEPAAVPLGGAAVPSQPLTYVQQGTYAQPGGYVVNSQSYYPTVPSPPGVPAQPFNGGMTAPQSQPLSYAQQGSYIVSPQAAGTNTTPAAQVPKEPGLSSSNGRPW